MSSYTDDYEDPRDWFDNTPLWREPVKKKVNVKSHSLKAKLAVYDKRIATMQRAIQRLEGQKAAVDIDNAEWFGTKITNMKDSHLCNALRWAGRKFNVVQIRDHDYEQRYAISGPGQVYEVYNIMFDEALKRGLRF